jgi:hypothetical protein
MATKKVQQKYNQASYGVAYDKDDHLHIVKGKKRSVLFMYRDGKHGFVLSSPGRKGKTPQASLGGDLGEIPCTKSEHGAELLLAMYFSSWNCDME